MISLALPLVLLCWLLIHFIYRFYIPADKSRGILPTSLTNRKRISTTITLRTLHLRVESTAFNFHHDALSHRLTRSSTARLPTTLRAAFDLGIVISLLGMVVALALLSWTFMLLARRLVADLVPPSPDIHTHVKRAYQNDYISPTLPAREPVDIPVQLLVRVDHFARIIPTHPSTQIPGVTLPLSHLPILIGALFFSQTIHEAGHAVCAALSVVLLPRPVLR
jgi:S2P endopeptidase